MALNISNYILKMSGKCELPKEIAIGNNYSLRVSGAITGENTSDNDDGTMSKTYLFRPVLVEIENELGERIKGKDVRSRSQQMRNLLYKRWREQDEPISFEEYYDKEMVKIMSQI